MLSLVRDGRGEEEIGALFVVVFDEASWVADPSGSCIQVAEEGTVHLLPASAVQHTSINT